MNTWGSGRCVTNATGDERDTSVELRALRRVGGEVGSHHEELPLQDQDVLAHVRVLAERSGEPEGRHGFVGGAVRVRGQVAFGDPAPEQEPGGPVVPGLRVDARHRELA